MSVKIGDRVRYIGHAYRRTTGVVVDLHHVPGYPIGVKFDGDCGEVYPCTADELELDASKPFDTLPYRRCCEEDSKINSTWEDKPLRVVYDLCAEGERLQIIVAGLGRRGLLTPSEISSSGWDAVKDRLEIIHGEGHAD